MEELQIILRPGQDTIVSEYKYLELSITPSIEYVPKQTSKGKYKKFKPIPKIKVDAKLEVLSLKNSFLRGGYGGFIIFEDDNKIRWRYCGSGIFRTVGEKDNSFNQKITRLILIASIATEV